MSQPNQKKVQQHIAQWRHNRAFAKTIDPAYIDWQVNVIFYAALHAIDAALASLGVSAASHSERNNEVQTNQLFAGVRNQYKNLYRISRITRYDADPNSWLPRQYLSASDLVEDLLRPIENGLQQLVPAIKFDPLPLKK